MYGPENEIFVHTYLKQAKSHNLVAEQEGRTTVDVPSRAQEAQNTWVLVSAKTPNDDFNEEREVLCIPKFRIVRSISRMLFA